MAVGVWTTQMVKLFYRPLLQALIILSASPPNLGLTLRKIYQGRRFSKC